MGIRENILPWSPFGLCLTQADLTRSLVGLQAAVIGLLTALAMLLNSSPGGIAAIILLARLAVTHPAKVLAVWGAIYVPVTAVWTLPALDGPVEMAGAVFGYASCGAIFYGGAGVFCARLLRSYPALVVGLSFGVAEAVSAALGLVMAPVGLFAVNGSLGYLVAWFSVVGASAIIGIATSVVAQHIRFAFPCAALASVLLIQIPEPPRPDYDGSPIHGIAHNPDPQLKWSSPVHAAENFDRLQEMSDSVAKDGLIVWPEGAVTGTFDLGEAVSGLDPDHLPLLFGMTRYAEDGSPELRNSTVLVTRESVQVSDKQQLVPFYEGAVPFLYETDLVSGTRRVQILSDGTKVLPLICYEVFTPRPWFLNRTNVDLIVVLSAETGFAERFGPSIMKRQVEARELETGVRVLWVSDRPSDIVTSP